MKENVKEAQQFYDKFAKIYAEYTFPKLMQFQLNDFISMLPKKAKVLDLGCGSGRDAHYLHDYGLDVTAIDISDSMLKEAKARAEDIKFKKMDMRKLSFSKEIFDGIWIMATLTTIEKKDALVSLKEAARVIKKNGILYLAVKEGKGEIIQLKPQYGNVPKFYSLYEQQEIENIVKEAGFIITKSTVEEDSASGQRWIEIFAKLSS